MNGASSMQKRIFGLLLVAVALTITANSCTRTNSEERTAKMDGQYNELTPEEELELADAALRLRSGAPGRTSREPVAATSAETGAVNSAGAAPAAAKAGSLVSTITGESSGGGNPAGGDDREAEPKPTRLKLSGGNACLSGSSGRFCKN